MIRCGRVVGWVGRWIGFGFRGVDLKNVKKRLREYDGVNFHRESNPKSSFVSILFLNNIIIIIIN